MNILVTKKFKRNYEKFKLKYKNFDDILSKFVEFKLKNPLSIYNPKDSSMTTAHGFRRCHLVHGKAILIYRIADDNLELCDIVEHNSIESGRDLVNLADYLKSISSTDLVNFSLKEETKLSSEQINDVKDILYDLAVSDRNIIVDASNGMQQELFQYLRLVIADQIPDEEKDKIIISSFGGIEKFKELLQYVLKTTKISESMSFFLKIILGKKKPLSFERG